MDIFLEIHPHRRMQEISVYGVDVCAVGSLTFRSPFASGGLGTLDAQTLFVLYFIGFDETHPASLETMERVEQKGDQVIFL